MAHKGILRGQAIDVKADVRNVKRERVDADTITVTIRDANGVVVVNAQAMTEEIPGVYTYAHQTGANDPVGTWTAEVTVIEGDFTSPEVQEFEVVAG